MVPKTKDRNMRNLCKAIYKVIADYLSYDIYNIEYFYQTKTAV